MTDHKRTIAGILVRLSGLILHLELLMRTSPGFKDELIALMQKHSKTPDEIKNLFK